MNIDKAVFILAGSMLLAGAVLSWLVHPLWILLSVFVGVNMLQAAFTGFCPSAMVFKALGVRPGAAFR